MMDPSHRGVSYNHDQTIILNYAIIILKSRTDAISTYIYLERIIRTLLDT